jgi:mono/diheme cytochrome c family protein
MMLCWLPVNLRIAMVVFVIRGLLPALMVVCLGWDTVVGSASGAEKGTQGGSLKGARKPDWSLYYAGEYVYERNCQMCHGRRGDGQGKWAADILPKPRSFKHANFKYRSTPFGRLPTEEDLKRTIRGGRSNTAMGMFTKLSDRELNAVVEYIKFFSPKWRDPEFIGESMNMPPRPHWFADEGERRQRAMAGRTLYELACQPCHGEKGEGNGPNAGELRDHLNRPIRPADLRNPHLRVGKEPEDIVRTLMTGLNGTPMLSFAETLQPEQMWELAAYVDLLRAGNKEHRGRP